MRASLFYRIMRTFLKLAGALVLLLALLLLLALKRVDYTPYFETDYYARTRSRLDSLSAQLSKARGAVELGFGKASLTPVLGATEEDPETGAFAGIPLAGYGDRQGAFAEGIHDSIFVKALAFRVQEQVLVLIASDMLIVPPVVTEGVSRFALEQLGLGRDQLFFSATHTHSALGAWSEGFVGKQFAGESHAGVQQWLVNQFCTALEEAVEDLQPGRVGSGSFQAPDLVSNRLVGEKGRKNSEFIYLLAIQDSGKKAILGSFDAHATTLGDENMLISADYPGYWQRKLEQEGADLALFLAGSVGSHSPGGQGEAYDRARFIGEKLADGVLADLEETGLRDTLELSFLSLKMELPEYHIRVADGLRLRPVLGAKLFPPPGDVYLQGARMGDLIWVSTPCDFSGEMALDVKCAMENAGYRAVVSSFNGAYAGYIIPGKYYHLNAYESRLMSWYGPDMGPYFRELIGRMTGRLALP